MTQSLFLAVGFGQARILRLLLTAGGEEGRSGRANTPLTGSPPLHFGAIRGHPAVVSALLEAGADKAARDSKGRIPRDVIGVDIGLHEETQADRGNNVAIRRNLMHGPAYRARSWAWPSDEEANAGRGSGGDGDTVAAAAAAAAAIAAAPATLAPAADAVLPSPPAVKQTPPVIGVRIFRAKGSTSSKFFLGLFGR